MRCEELLKGNGISEGAARVSWCERELLIGQTNILFYFILKKNIFMSSGLSLVLFSGSLDRAVNMPQVFQPVVQTRQKISGHCGNF